MSRCVLNNKETGHEVTIGWDRPFDTFFAQVNEPDGDDPIVWLGTKSSEFVTPDVLIEAISPFACKFNREVLVENLIFDKQNNSARTYAIHGDIVENL